MNEIQYRGVKGWLLLLSINLTILDPFSILLNLIIATDMAKPYFEKYPELLLLTLISGTLRIALMVFSVYAGISLWKVFPNAVSIAEKYFIAAILYTILSIYLPYMVGLPKEIYRDIAGTTFITGLITLLYIALWYLYLKKSKRVHATYGVIHETRQ